MRHAQDLNVALCGGKYESIEDVKPEKARELLKGCLHLGGEIDLDTVADLHELLDDYKRLWDFLDQKVAEPMKAREYARSYVEKAKGDVRKALQDATQE